MKKKEALEILINREIVMGKYDGTTILISHKDIKSNLECNDFEINLDFIQDFESINNNNYEMFQGHCLREIILE